jgi:hypothetical protein
MPDPPARWCGVVPLKIYRASSMTTAFQAQGAEDLPATGALLRPALAHILSRAPLAAGVKVRLGVTFTELRQSPENVDVKSTDSTSGRYDLAWISSDAEIHVGLGQEYGSHRRRLVHDATC